MYVGLYKLPDREVAATTVITGKHCNDYNKLASWCVMWHPTAWWGLRLIRFEVTCEAG